MTDTTVNPYKALQDHYATRDPELAAALRTLAFPHWFDDALAVELLERFTSANGGTARLLDRVKRLPVVAPYEGRGWRILERAREALLDDVSRNADLGNEIDRFIAEFLDEQRNGLELADARELHWRLAYHIAPSEPGRAIETLAHLVSSREAETADVASALDLFEQRTRYLSEHKGAAEFFVGMAAYRRKQYAEAAKAFDGTLASNADDRLKLVAGNLLGRILSLPPDHQFDQAIEVLEDTLDLVQPGRDETQRLHLTATLADVLSARGTSADLEQAAILLRSRLESPDDPAVQVDRALAQLGRVLFRLGPEHWSEAELLLAEAVKLASPTDYEALNGRILSLSQLAEAQGNLGEALVQMERKLELDEAADRQDRVALDLARMERLKRRLG